MPVTQYQIHDDHVEVAVPPGLYRLSAACDRSGVPVILLLQNHLHQKVDIQVILYDQNPGIGFGSAHCLPPPL